jgi:Domain of unknown function DUF29
MEGPMADSSLYDEDILIWSEQQAAALRSLANRRDLPNELDLANVIEEIEDVGRSEFHTVESLVENILTHLVLLAADPDAPATRGWIAEITAWNLTLRRRITPSMQARFAVALARFAGGRRGETCRLGRRQGCGGDQTA